MLGNKIKQETNMIIEEQQVKALHLEGGNYFDDMRIDISESHRRFANLTMGTDRTGC